MVRKILLAIFIIAALTLSTVSCEGEVGPKGDTGEVGPEGPKGEPGKDGVDGEDGKTPTIEISDDGYWVINGEKTNVKAEGKDGVDGADGIDGENGTNGENGKTPYIKDGYWYIDGTNTGVKAEGKDGEDATIIDENPAGLDFLLKDDGTYAVAMGNARYLSKLVIPESYKGRYVTEIAPYGFFVDDESVFGVEEVVIPSSVTYIGEGAFLGLETLMQITIPTSVEKMDEDVFLYCGSIIIYCEAESTPEGWHSDWYHLSGKESEGKEMVSSVIFDCKNNEVAEDGARYAVIDGISYRIANGVAEVYKISNESAEIIIPESIDLGAEKLSVTAIKSDAYDYYCLPKLKKIVIPTSVTVIEESAIEGYDLLHVCYTGTSAEWSAVTIGEYNELDLDNVEFEYGK